MRVDISKITNVISKINDITSGDKTIPGLLLDLSENLLKVRYSDGHKSFTEDVVVVTDETDRFGAIAVDFTQFKRAIDNCQPSGIIKVSDVTVEYKDKVITVSVNQLFEETDSEGNVVNVKNSGKKSMDIAWNEPGSDMRSSILTRMKYDDIFESDGIDDEYDKKEFLDALSRTSTEKGKQIYLSTKTQTIFVANQAHVTTVPISKCKELTQEEMDVIRAELVEKGAFTEEAYADEIKKAENRMHYSVVISQQLAKAIIGVFNKSKADKVYLHTKDKFCSIFIDTEDEKIGFWFEMGMASKAHIGTLERYNSLGFKTYQLTFLREFLANNIKSALNATKSEKITLSFSDKDGELLLSMLAGSSSASTSDVYETIATDFIELPDNKIVGKSFNVSLSVLSAMIEQLKTDIVALDFECSNDTVYLRLSEIDYVKEDKEYEIARRETQRLCESQGIQFDPNSTPTPVELKLGYREKTLSVKQFTMLAR